MLYFIYVGALSVVGNADGAHSYGGVVRRPVVCAPKLVHVEV